MSDAPLDKDLTHKGWVGFWCMITQQAQNAFNDKVAQFTLIPLGAAVGFSLVLPIGRGVEVDVPSAAGLMIALPYVLFAPLAGWISDRFSKRNVMLTASALQSLVLFWICAAVMMRNMPLALCGFFALAVQSAFFSPAKIGINKELVGSKRLGFATGIQQMTTILAILVGQIAAGWLFDHRFAGHGGEPEVAWKSALGPLGVLAAISLPSLLIALRVPRVPAQGGVPFSRKIAVGHFISLADLWQDIPLRRASLGVAFFWGFAAFINLWSVKLAKELTGGGEGFGTLSSIFMASASLGMAAGFGFASYLLRKRIELGWVPVAGVVMTASALALAFMTPGGWVFLITLGLLAFAGAVFLAPLNAWMQDHYPSDKRGDLQAAANLQDCFAGIVAVIFMATLEHLAKVAGISMATGFRFEIGIVGVFCGLMTLSIIRLLPRDFIRFVGLGIIHWIYRVKVVHADRVPDKGGVLILPNHVTFVDAFLITAACPRPVRFVMDDAFMASRVIRIFVSIFDTVTIRRDQPREAIRITIDALKSGDAVVLFPEGQLTRTGALGELHRGFELIAKKAAHPLVPMWCDGSWGSIFSFERGRFFKKKPYHLPYGLAFAFGESIQPDKGTIETVRSRMQQCSANAIEKRFSLPGWGMRIPRGESHAIAGFRAAGEAVRRRAWVNGHQLGQVNALQRKTPFAVLARDSAVAGIPALSLTFPELFSAEVKTCDRVETHPVWVGGASLREAIASRTTTGEIQFYDFGPDSIQPFESPGVLHLPCLAVDGMVIAMSMPHPAKHAKEDAPQPGHKVDTWGKLLPGWYLITGEDGSIRAHGPAAPEEGLLLPAGCSMDNDGLLVAAGR